MRFFSHNFIMRLFLLMIIFSALCLHRCHYMFVELKKSLILPLYPCECKLIGISLTLVVADEYSSSSPTSNRVVDRTNKGDADNKAEIDKEMLKAMDK